MKAPHYMDGAPPPTPPKEKAWVKVGKFFQTSIGTWLLTTVAAGLITWGYTVYSQNRAAELIRVQKVKKLEWEISQRFEFAMRQILRRELAIAVRDKDSAKTQLISQRAGLGLPDGSEASLRLNIIFGRPEGPEVLNAEFADKSMISLLAEYLQIAPPSPDRQAGLALRVLYLGTLFDEANVYFMGQVVPPPQPMITKQEDRAGLAYLYWFGDSAGFRLQLEGGLDKISWLKFFHEREVRGLAELNASLRRPSVWATVVNPP